MNHSISIEDIARKDLKRIVGVLEKWRDAAPVIGGMLKFTDPEKNRMSVRFHNIPVDMGYEYFKSAYLDSDDLMRYEIWMLVSEFGTRDLKIDVLWEMDYMTNSGRHALLVERLLSPGTLTQAATVSL